MPDLRVKIMVYQQDGTVISQYLLGEGEHTIGRDPSSAIYCESAYISNDHAKLHLSDEGIFIEDLKSTSGTFLDQVSVRGKVRLTPGQRLQVGDLHIDLQLEGVGDLSPGVKIGSGRYELVKELGRGAMGQVWLAQDTQLEEYVAIKVLPSDVANDAVCLLDLKREVQKSRKLSHDNIIRIHDLIQLPGENPFVSLEYVEGTDLHAIQMNQADRIFGWEDLKPYVLQLCDALHYAHERKIVHRDLKPSNVMVTNDGVLKLADFGIAASIADATGRSSMANVISGTPQFMSPQQMLGESPKASDDVYALGATMYCLLTGRPPFHTGDVAQQVQHITPAPLEQRLKEFGLENEVPDYVNDLVMSCLAKDPTARPATVSAIGEWLRSGGKSDRPAERKKTETGIERMVAEKPAEAAEAEPAADEQSTQEQQTQARPQDAEEKKSPVLAIAAAFIVVAGLSWFFMGGADKDNENANLQPAGEGTGSTDGNQQSSATDSLKEGLVAYYPFNGNAKDESGNGNDGEVKGATLATDRHGKKVSAYSFDGTDDYIGVNDAGSLRPDYITVSVWFKSPFSSILINKSELTRGKRHPRYAQLTFGEQFCVKRESQGQSTLGWQYSGAAPASSIDVWEHRVGLWDGQKVKLYVNGELAASKDGLAGPMDNISGGNLNFGVGWDLEGDYFQGQMDDIRIYNRALSAEEVSALYDLEKPKTDLKRGLVAYYPFNGNAKDESGNGLDGTVQEGQLYPDKNGKADSSYEFKGKGRIALPESQKFELQKLTLSAWVNVDAAKLAGNGYRFLIDKRNKGGSVQHYALMYTPSEAFAIYGHNPTTRANTYHSTSYGDSRPKGNQWAMVTGTYDGLNRKLYVDGKLVDHKTGKVSVLNQRPFDLAIGCSIEDGQTAHWRIDDVRIYDRALSAEEITALYDLEKPKTDLKKGLVAYYPFNGNAKDESGNGHDGTVNGATLTADRHDKANNAYDFDGKSWIDLQQSEKLKFGAEDFTYSAWIKTEKVKSNNKYGWYAIAEDRNTGRGGRRLGIIGADGETVCFRVSAPDASPPGGSTASVAVPNTLTDSQWHHIVGIRRGYNFLLGIDGKVVASVEDRKVTSSDAPARVRIGARDAFDEFIGAFYGKIDDVRIYNRALSAEEVSALYDLEKPSSETADLSNPPVPGAVKWNGHWYAYFTDQISWMDAKEKCEEYGGHLIIIDSDEENEFARKLANEKGRGQSKIWLGASDHPKKDRVFIWVSPNGKKLSDTFNKWSDDAFLHGKFQPNSSVEMTVIGPDPNRVKKWDFVTAKGVKSPFICEWEDARHTGRATANSPEAIAAVEAAIRKAANKPTGELTEADFKKVKALDLRDLGLTKIPRILKELQQLERLSFHANKLRNIDELPELKNLKHLNLGENQLTDISPLTDLTSLEDLQLPHNQITDLQPLLNLVNLKAVTLTDNPNLKLTQIINFNTTLNLKQKKLRLPLCIVSTDAKK